MTSPANHPQPLNGSNVDQCESDISWMRYALQLAELAAKQDEVPVGAVLVCDEKEIASGFNCPISTCDPTAHAEIVAIRAGAKKIGNYRLLQTTLYVTLEPCLMCIGAMLHARIHRLVYGASDPKRYIDKNLIQEPEHINFNHKIKITSGILASESKTLLQKFFKIRR